MHHIADDLTNPKLGRILATALKTPHHKRPAPRQVFPHLSVQSETGLFAGSARIQYRLGGNKRACLVTRFQLPATRLFRVML